MKSAMLNRPSVEALLPPVEAPTMMIAPTDHPMLSVAQVRAAVAALPHAVMVEMRAAGHVAPVLALADQLADTVIASWRTRRAASRADVARVVSGR